MPPITFQILHRLSASIPCIAELAVVLTIHFLSTLSTEVLSHLVLSGQPPIARVNCCFLLGSVIAAIGGLGWLCAKDHVLVMTGPYVLVRHPGYLFGQLSVLKMSLCGWLGMTVMGVVIGVWPGAMQNVLDVARCRSEDALLRAQFGKERERVPYRMIPSVYY
ncbi:hypothetical protein V8E55_004121 [Tylopilus felleus]